MISNAGALPVVEPSMTRVTLRRSLPGALFALGLASSASAQGATTPIPATGLDFSAIDHFWRLASQLSAGQSPTDAEWRAMLDTPGYQLAELSIGKVVREDMEIALLPSRRADFDSLSRLPNDRAGRIVHLRRAVSKRRELEAMRKSLEEGVPVADAIGGAQVYLPTGATQRGQPPFVAFALFRNDAYAQQQGVIVDLLNVHENGLNPMLAHEFHHTYLGRLNALPRADLVSAPDNALAAAFRNLRNEGIADLVDKPYPLVMKSEARVPYVTRYNKEYDGTAATLRTVDSLITWAGDDTTRLREIGPRVRNLFWSNGHPNGAYIARTIEETFGKDSLWPGVSNPAAFLRTYLAAERTRGHPAPLGAATMGTIAQLERRYWLVGR